MGQYCKKPLLYFKLLGHEYDGKSHFPLLTVTASSAFGADSTFGDCQGQVPHPVSTRLLPAALRTPRSWLRHRELAPSQPITPLQSPPLSVQKYF